MIRVANASCSWGVIENVAGERGGYSWVLDEMHETGYRGTELGDWGFMPTDPNTLRHELQARDLNLLASWVSVYLRDPSRLGESEAAAVRTARLLAEVGGPNALIVLGNDPYTAASAGAIPLKGCAAMPTACGMSTSKITTRGSPNNPGATGGMPFSPSNTACSAN